jgi:hypothetical protein
MCRLPYRRRYAGRRKECSVESNLLSLSLAVLVDDLDTQERKVSRDDARARRVRTKKENEILLLAGHIVGSMFF